MNKNRPRMRAAHPILLATTVVIALLGVQMARELPARASESARNVNLARVIVPGTDADPQHLPLSTGCQDYIQAMVWLKEEVLAPDQLAAAAERWSSCWPDNRKRLLQAQLVGAMASLGQWDDICLELSSVQAVDRLLTMVEQAADDDKWEVVSLLLVCLEQTDWGDAWVSPWRMAILYQRLGQQLEYQQDLQPALDAYQSAANWHPGVWAMPYLQAASVLWRQDRRPEAVNLLAAALGRSPDNNAAFQLWYQLAEYLALQGKADDSTCAFHQAANLAAYAPVGFERSQLQSVAEVADTQTPNDCLHALLTQEIP